MKSILVTGSIFVLACVVVVLYARSIEPQEKPVLHAPTLYDFKMNTIEGEEKSLGDYRGKVLLVVNVASECGHTPQYKDMESVYRTYQEKGLAILGFPANNFFGQEPGSDEEIKDFCERNYGVTFDMFSKISVKGDDQHPLYRFLTTAPGVEGAVKWNFQKYLIDRQGKVIARFSPGTKPTDQEVVSAIEKLLAGT